MALCWGGEGVKGDTQRVALRLLARLMSNMLASQGATELGRVERPVSVAGAERLSCPHCGFQQMDRRAHYCPKCGLRMAGN
jgi:formamidopyrimidine-DNA glycosylase